MTQRRWNWSQLACFALAAVAHAPSLWNDYCYDDVGIVRDNPQLQSASPWRSIWATDYWKHQNADVPNRDLLYRPITMTSFRTVRAVLGPSPAPQHAVNLLIHALNTVLLMRLLRLIGLSHTCVFASGALFSVLPVRCEAVVALVGRADLLATLGILSVLICHCKSLQLGGIGSRNPTTLVRLQNGCGSFDKFSTSPSCIAWRIAASAFAFVAIGSKENAASIVCILPFCDLYWLRRVKADAQAKGINPLGIFRSLSRTSYVWIPILAYGVLRYDALGGRLFADPPLTRTVNLLVDSGWSIRVLGALQAWGMYWSKTFWPAILTISYTPNAVTVPTGLNSMTLLGIIVLASLAAWSVVCFRRNNESIGLLSLILLASYAPTSNAFLLMHTYFGERTWYLPSALVCGLLGALASDAWIVARPSRARGIAVKILAIPVLAAMTTRTALRAFEWRNEETLYAAAFRDHPEAVGALEPYGEWLARNGKPQWGIDLLSRAVLIDPGYTEAHRALGFAYGQIGDTSSAIRHWQIAAMQVPEHAETKRQLRRAAQAPADSASVHSTPFLSGDEGAALQRAIQVRDSGDAAGALVLLEAGADRFKNSARWKHERAITLVVAGRPDDAMTMYRSTIAADLTSAQPMIELAMLLLERRAKGDILEASRISEKAIRIAPTLPAAWACRAEILIVEGRAREGREAYQKAIFLAPASSMERNIFEQRSKTLGGG